MWLILAFVSAALLGCYDAFKKEALDGNGVIPVLFLNTCAMGGMGMSSLHLAQKCDSVVLLAFRLFRDEALAAHHCRANQCHTSGDGAMWRNVSLWRAFECLAMGGRCACRGVFLHAQ